MISPFHILAMILGYVISVVIVVTDVNKIALEDRKLTKHQWIRIAMAIFAPIVIVGIVIGLPFALGALGIKMLWFKAETGLRRLIAGESTAHPWLHQSTRYEEEESSDWEAE